MKIAIVVHGRFHAFNLTRALLKRNHKVILFTNYPKWVVERFGVSKKYVRSFPLHGVVARLLWWLHHKFGFPYPEAFLHRAFGLWAAKGIQKEHWDVVHSFSGVAEELLQTLKGSSSLTVLVRGSAHIRTQARILKEEEERTGILINEPSPWMIAREEREYALGDRVIVLSKFAFESFVNEKFPSEKLRLLPLGVQMEEFRPSREVVEARYRRILDGQPLLVLYVGAISFRKGMWDMLKIVQSVNKKRFQFTFVGTATAEIKKITGELRNKVVFVPKQPEQKLLKWYAEADLFIFPTIEDGFAQVLTQAQASALPILTTTNCAGSDLIRQGEIGWVLPIRQPEAFVNQLKWCDENRENIAEMVWRIYREYHPRNWSDVGTDFEKICLENLKREKSAN